MSVAPASKEVLEQADVLAAWLQQISDDEHWRPYRGSVEIEQCSHPDRTSRVRPLISAGNVETKGRAAFLLRCRGPSRESLEPTSLEMFPGEILTLYHDKDFPLTMDGKPLIVGERTIITQPASINVAPGDMLLLIVIFTKR
ncbi:hypothetical protein V500_02313 [Pseudogymnoascus sp. VKM F-4518 (FW-2643)]|nr:hypothetical protein V500_02313 [Pseudogymnoascus sp. VKM F-4518 (FW-2643)]